MRTESHAFTLTEMLVVLIVIGILAGMLLPAVGRFRIHSYKTGTAYEISQLDSACRQFRLDIGCYPPDFYNSSSDAGRLWPWENPPRYNVGMVLGVIPYDGYLYTYAYGDENKLGNSPSLNNGNPSKLLVYWLSTRFIVGGKSYGPYYSFDPKQLVPTGEKVLDSGNASVGGRTVRWWCQGIDDQALARTGRVIPTEEPTMVRGRRSIPLYKYYDKYGVLKPKDATNRNFYVYDCYSPGGAVINRIMHNVGEFDIFSYGLDGLSVYDNRPGSRTANQAAIEDLKKTGYDLWYYLGAVGDDQNNWTETFKGRRVRTGE